MNRVKGIFAGLTNLDITYYQSDFPQENFKSKTNHFQTFIGGPAANAAITYAILGGDATIVTCLGDTTIAKAMKSEFLEMYQVNIVDLAEGSELLPSISSVFVNTEKATRTIWSGQQQFSISEETGYEKYISEASFCFSDCNLPEVTIDFLKKSRKLGKEIVLDPGSWKPHFPTCLALADEVIASVNCRPPEGDLLTFLQETNVKNIAITDGENDTYWYENANQGLIHVPKVEAIDTLAAGDVLHGAFCYYRFHEGLPFCTAMEKATLVASESVKYFGPREGVYKIVELRG
nr:PfkB family carbohydrate kinase [Ammoniphilus resinae]